MSGDFWLPAGSDPAGEALPLPDPPPPPGPAGTRMVVGTIADNGDLDTAPTVYLEGSTTAVPCRVLGSYLPIAGHGVMVLLDAGDVVVLGPIGAGQPGAIITTPLRLFHGANSTGGTFGTSTFEIPLTAFWDIAGGFNAGTNRYHLPWTGLYRLHSYIVVAAGTGISYGGGAAINGGAGWGSFAQPPMAGAACTIVIAAVSPPLLFAAGTTASLGVFASTVGGSFGGGFARNNELVVEWLGPEYLA